MKRLILVVTLGLLIVLVGCGSSAVEETPEPTVTPEFTPIFVNPVLVRGEGEGAFRMSLEDICGKKATSSNCETDWDQGLLDFLSGTYASEIEVLQKLILAEAGQGMLDLVSERRWYILSHDSRVDNTFELIVRLNLEPFCPLEGELPGSGGSMRNEKCMEVAHVQTEGFLLIDITKEFPEVLRSDIRDRTN